VEFHFAAETKVLTYGDMDVPVPIPITKSKPGQVLWSWENGLPSWFRGRNPTGNIGRYRHHNEWSWLLLWTTIPMAHSRCVSTWTGRKRLAKVWRLRSVWPRARSQRNCRRSGASVSGITQDPPLDRNKLNRLRAQGFVRVDATGQDFVAADGTPFRIVGQNTPHLAMLSPTEQEKLLAQAEAAGITVTRFLIPDYAYRPLGEWNPEAFRRLQATVDRCASHGIRSVICLE